MRTGPMHRVVDFFANLKMSKARNIFLHPEHMMKHHETPLFLCQGCLVAKISIESHEAPADVRDNFTRAINNILTEIHGQSMRRSHSDIVNIVTGHSWDL